MKKTLFSLLAVGLSLSLLSACGGNGSSSGSSSEEERAKANQTALMQEAIQSVNAIPIVSSALKAKEQPPFDIYELVEKTEGMFINTMDVKREASDKEGYLYKNVVTLKGVVYQMYVSKETKTQEKDEEEQEIKTKYEGMVFVAETEFPFTGKETVETEEGEEEHEMSLNLQFDTNSFIYAKQELETKEGKKEEEFEFVTKVNGKVVDEYKIEREISKKETEIEVETKEGKYELEYFTKDSVDYLEVEYNSKKYLYKVIKTIVEGVEVITYELVEE